MPDTSPAPRILVIDDREQTRYVFRRLLTLAGYKVEEATTGSEGLAKSLRQPDLIIADFNLPDMLGFDLTRRLKSNPVTSSIPVLQISANFVSGESRVQALQSGADSYLIQPIDPALLLAQIHAMLRLKKAEAMSMLSGRQWQTTFDSLSDGLAIADSKGIIIRANRAFLNMLELTNSQAEGRPLAEVFESRFSTPLPAPDESLPAGSSAELTFAGNWFRFRHDPIQTETSETERGDSHFCPRGHKLAYHVGGGVRFPCARWPLDRKHGMVERADDPLSCGERDFAKGWGKDLRGLESGGLPQQ
jgi:DNA-binding response OmpR family regulator